jgi:hypothetical protein
LEPNSEKKKSVGMSNISPIQKDLQKKKKKKKNFVKKDKVVGSSIVKKDRIPTQYP